MENRLVSLSAAVAAAGLSAYLIFEAARSALTPDQDLMSVFAGAAYGDVFGFGFWPMWVVCALLQAVALLVYLRAARDETRRLFFGVLLAVFAVASIASFLSWHREEAVFWAKGRESHAV